MERKEQAKMSKRYFEDITDGEPLHCQKLIITREEIIEFAKRFDPQPFHILLLPPFISI
jgi:acyl dehydratase